MFGQDIRYITCAHSSKSNLNKKSLHLFTCSSYCGHWYSPSMKPKMSLKIKEQRVRNKSTKNIIEKAKPKMVCDKIYKHLKYLESNDPLLFEKGVLKLNS